MSLSAASPPQAPRTSWLKRVLGSFYFTGVFWYRLHLFAARAVPDWLMGFLVLVFSSGFFLALGRVRRAVASNLDLVLGKASPLERLRRAWRTIHTFSWTLTERYEQFVPGKSFDMRLEDGEMWEELIWSGREFILVT